MRSTRTTQQKFTDLLREMLATIDPAPGYIELELTDDLSVASNVGVWRASYFGSLGTPAKRHIDYRFDGQNVTVEGFEEGRHSASWRRRADGAGGNLYVDRLNDALSCCVGWLRGEPVAAHFTAPVVTA